MIVTNRYDFNSADPESTPFKEQIPYSSAIDISRNVRRYGVRLLRVAHNSLYAVANELGHADQNTAYEARNRLWTEILERDAR